MNGFPVVSRLSMVIRFSVVSRLVVVRRLVVVSRLALRWGAKQPPKHTAVFQK